MKKCGAFVKFLFDLNIKWNIYIKIVTEKLLFLSPNWQGIKVSLLITFLVILVRELGFLQFIEFDALNWYFQSRGIEGIDKRIVLVEIRESDLNKFDSYPISDYELFQLLSKIQEKSPRLIGLDIYRDRAVKPDYKDGTKKLISFFDLPSSRNIIGIEKSISIDGSPAIAPHPVLAEYGQIGSNDVFLDADRVIRRAALFVQPSNEREIPSFNFLLASQYLQQSEHPIALDAEKNIKIGSTSIPPIKSNSGGYTNIYSGGYQIFLNYRSTPDRFIKVAANDVIENKIPARLLKDKIVIICTNTPSIPDLFSTPFPSQIPGGWVQANATSQLISAALDGRPLLKTLPVFWEIFWIGIGIFLTANILVKLGKDEIWHWNVGQKKVLKNQKRFFYLKSIATGALVSSSVLLITWIAFSFYGWWLPIAPVIFGIFLVIPYGINEVYIEKLKEAHNTKDYIIARQTKELREKNAELILRQEQLVAQKKLASIGLILAGICHDIGNSINGISYMLSLSAKTNEKFQKRLSDNNPIDESDRPHLSELCERMIKYNSRAKQGLKSTNLILNKIKAHSSHQRETELNLVKANINEEIKSNLGTIKYSREASWNEDERDTYKNFNRVIWTFYDDTIEDFYFDLTDLDQVIQNLVINALHAVDSKRLKIRDDEYQPKISVSTRNSSSLVKIIVEDNGLGIPSDLIDRVFEPHFTTKPPERGSGLGLSNVRDCLLKSGAEYKLESSLGKGTKFIIFWPKRAEIIEVIDDGKCS